MWLLSGLGTSNGKEEASEPERVREWLTKSEDMHLRKRVWVWQCRSFEESRCGGPGARSCQFGLDCTVISLQPRATLPRGMSSAVAKLGSGAVGAAGTRARSSEQKAGSLSFPVSLPCGG